MIKLNIFPYLIDFLPFLSQVLSLYVYAILLKEFRHSMVLGKSNTKVSEKYCRAPVYIYRERERERERESYIDKYTINIFFDIKKSIDTNPC